MADPVYADAIRTALKLGYKIVPYEDYLPECKSPDDDPESCDDQRERGQAKNLYERILKNDPKAKIFVHVGRGHNQKNAVSKKFNFMGYYFKNLTKIEPFTIDRLRFSERPDTALEQPLYRFLAKRLRDRNDDYGFETRIAQALGSNISLSRKSCYFRRAREFSAFKSAAKRSSKAAGRVAARPACCRRKPCLHQWGISPERLNRQI